MMQDVTAVAVRLEPEMVQSPELTAKLTLPPPDPPEVVRARVEPKATVVSEEMKMLAWFAFENVKVAAVEVADS